MNDSKPWYASMTIWAALVTLVATLLAKFGYTIDDSMKSDLAEKVYSLAQLIGGIVVIIGRVRAQKQVVLRDPSLPSILLLLLACSCIGGCADTPAKRWAQSRETLTSANNLFSDAAAGGHLTDRQILEYGGILQSATTLLGDAKTQLPAGGDTFESKLRQVSELLARIQKILVEQSHGPATHPHVDRRGPGERRIAYEAGGDHAYQGRDYRRAAGRSTAACGSVRCAA